MPSKVDDFTRAVRTARETFLTTGRAAPTVRTEIEASWRRSSVSGVSPELRQLPGIQDLIELNSRLYVAAQPVLQELADRLSGTSTSIMLADKSARMISRWVGDPSLRRRLDRANSVESQSLHEEVAGTNGLGSVLAEKAPVHVSGPEHYIEAFQSFSCVGAPVRYPLHGQIEGIVTLVVRYGDTNDLLFPLVLQVAEEIQHRMLLQATARERMLLDTFLSVARRSTRPVVSVTDQLIITNPAAARLLDGVDHAMLWEFAAQASTPGVHSAKLPLSDGEVVSARIRPVDDGVAIYGAVIEIDSSASAGRRRVKATWTSLPGLAGASAAWLRLCDSAVQAVRSGLPLVVSGERGVGKLALLEAAITASGASLGISVVDASLEPVEGVGGWIATVRERLAAGQAVVVRHVESLGDAPAQALAAIVDGLPISDGARIVATRVTGDAPPRATVQQLLDRLAVAQLEIPPLRHRREDIPELVAALTRRHVGERPLVRWNAEAVAALVSADWPGNVRQLENIVRRVVSGRLGGDVHLGDLPNEIRERRSGRTLAGLEQAELHAILVALENSGGNKVRAAASLGISRSTLYRKLQAFGIPIG